MHVWASWLVSWLVGSHALCASGEIGEISLYLLLGNQLVRACV